MHKPAFPVREYLVKNKEQRSKYGHRGYGTDTDQEGGYMILKKAPFHRSTDRSGCRKQESQV